MSLFSLLSQSVHNLVPCPSGVVMLMLFCGQHQMIPVSDCLLVAEIILKLVAQLLLKAVGASCLGCPLMLCDFLLYLEIRTLDLETNLCLSRGMWSNLSGQLLMDVGEHGVFLLPQQPNDMAPLCSWLGAVLRWRAALLFLHWCEFLIQNANHVGHKLGLCTVFLV